MKTEQEFRETLNKSFGKINALFLGMKDDGDPVLRRELSLLAAEMEGLRLDIFELIDFVFSVVPVREADQ